MGPRDPQADVSSRLFLITPDRKLPRCPSVMDGAQTLGDSQNWERPSHETNALLILTITGANLKRAAWAKETRRQRGRTTPLQRSARTGDLTSQDASNSHLLKARSDQKKREVFMDGALLSVSCSQATWQALCVHETLKCFYAHFTGEEAEAPRIEGLCSK